MPSFVMQTRGAAGAHRRPLLCCGLVGLRGPTTPVRAVFSSTLSILQNIYYSLRTYQTATGQRNTQHPRLTSLLVVLAVVSLTPTVSASDINWPHVEATLIAEAASEGEAGMLAVAEVMRARQWNLRPFCASRRKDLSAFVARQPVATRQAAKRAIAAARAGSQTVRGATHYENVAAFGVPSWAKGKTPVATVGRHTFWKLPR